MKRLFFLGALMSLCAAAEGETFDLTASLDSTTVLRNPDKGWYHHYYDNGIDKYLVKNDADLENFPGMNHLYLRLAWSFLEPQEGEFNWEIIDKVIEKWTAKGYDISFRITCRETGLEFATPKWLYDQGLPGKFIENWGMTTFEPDYGHPQFLQKLEQFHRVFAERYDGRPWLLYVDIGSYGDWGEGHTSFGSKVAWPNEVLKKHIDIYTKYYKRTQIVVSDDFLHHRSQADADDLRRYIDECGIAWRDDSILVDWYVQQNADTYSVSHPHLFRDSWPTRPTIIEMQHYHLFLKYGNWQGLDGSIRGAEILLGACDIMRPTWIGYHGYADQWLNDNPNLTRRLANKVGYWYFLKSLTIASSSKPGTQTPLTLTVENHGYAPAYKRYRVLLKLEGAVESYEQVLTDIDNRTWMPGQTVAANASLSIPSSLTPGIYKIKLKIIKDDLPTPRTVYLALQEKLKDADDYYEIGSITVEAPTVNQSPEIELNVTPLEGDAPLEVWFDASGSTDADGDPLNFSWDFGDGAVAEGAVVSNVYQFPSGYSAVLNVSDGRGGSAQAVQRLTVFYTPPPINRLPVAKVVVDRQSGELPLTVSFDASGSYDPESDPLTFRWAFGDGGTAEGARVSHQYTFSGEYTAELIVDDGNEIYNYVRKTFSIHAGSAQLLTGRIIGTEGSRNNAGTTVDKAFDGDLTTFFEGPDRDGSWAGIDLDGGKSNTAHVVKIAFLPAAKKSTRMIGGVFQGADSADFSDAVTLFTVTEQPSESELTTVVLNNRRPFRFLRYLGPARSYGAVAEVQFYGSFLTDIRESNESVYDFELRQNYPNPFNPATTIEFSLPKAAFVTLHIFNLKGEKTVALIDEHKTAGVHKVSWDASGLPSGMYLCRLEAHGEVQIRKMILLR